MNDIVGLAAANLLSPPVLFFVLGACAAAVRSDLSVPEAAAKTLSLYLLLAIGFKGGAAANKAGFTPELLNVALAGLALSFLLPLIAFPLFRFLARLDQKTAAATAAHYGSISIVTFVAGTDFAARAGLPVSGHMVAVAALMESPAILTGLLLAGMGGLAMGSKSSASRDKEDGASIWREVLFNGGVVLLIGAFIVGLVSGPAGMARLDPFVNGIFQGVLCLFLLDMGLIAMRRLRDGRGLKPGLVLAAVAMPLIGAALGLGLSVLLRLSVGDAAILTTLAASASYIAVPAAMRVALPEANPAAYLTASLGITFPFNLVVGLPLWFTAAQYLQG